MKAKIDKIKKCLIPAVLQTFEEMAFIQVVEDTSKTDKIAFQNCFKIDILEPFEASMVLFFTDSLKQMAGQNIYSSENSSLQENQLDDCFLEILNVLTGNFLNRYCEGKSYKVDLPEMILELSEVHKKKDSLDLIFNAENIYFKISYLEKEK